MAEGLSLDLRNKNYTNVPEELFENEALESLYIREGNQIPAYQLYLLLDKNSSLKFLDGQDVMYMRNGISNLGKIFLRRLQEMFLSKAASEIYNEPSNEQTRINKMIQLAKNTINAGPPLLKEFKDYKLEQLIEQNYDKYVSDALETNLERKSDKTPPVKKARQQKKSTPNILSKLKNELQLTWLLQTHSKENNPNDWSTKVWMCEFEPDKDSSGLTTEIVATCGGDSICFINCETGLVHKKYKQQEEVFYCIAWTVLPCRTFDGVGERKETLLAAAGVLGDIILINTEKLVCYRRIMHHKKPVDALIFHPMKPHWLFSGSEDGTIVLWDIGLPFITDDPSVKKKLTLHSSHSTIRQVAICPHGKIIFGACDDGLYAWNISEIEDKTELKAEYSFRFNSKSKPLDSANCINNNLIAVKRIAEGSILIFRSESEFLKDDAYLVQTLVWRKTKTPFLKFHYNAGSNILSSGDDEGTIWLYELKLEKKGKSYVDYERLVCSHNHTKIFNHVAISNPPNYVAAVSDTNVVALWKSS
ncbi:leucine-rich repeat and WD repeat-containing protein 1 isoform X1 [Hydra vulgaris]|uniref:leucine-rich repeat and WD repeat-containing protein 1 isoform X1 n=1 Tax=Hydra vulgaris TaxID=6087 RepID=UPI0032EA4F49